jgi:uncharacterized membrane protein YoaK (UPF0700 family)
MSVSEVTADASQGSLSERAARSIKHPLARTLLVLTFTTGLVDATSYLGLGHVFAANMTGNIVFLGFGIAGSGGLPVIAPLVSLGAFLVAQAQAASSQGRRRTAIVEISLGRWRSRFR